MEERTHSSTHRKLPAQLRQEMDSDQARRLASGVTRTIKCHLPIALMETARERTGLTNDEDVLQAALIHLVLDSDSTPS